MEKVVVYQGTKKGDLVRCTNCGKVMLLPFGADKCPECGSCGTSVWFDDEQESTIDELAGKGLQICQSDRELIYEDYSDPNNE